MEEEQIEELVEGETTEGEVTDGNDGDVESGENLDDEHGDDGTNDGEQDEGSTGEDTGENTDGTTDGGSDSTEGDGSDGTEGEGSEGGTTEGGENTENPEEGGDDNGDSGDDLPTDIEQIEPPHYNELPEVTGEYLIQGSTLKSIGDAIRKVDGTTDVIPVSNFSEIISSFVKVPRKDGTIDLTSAEGTSTTTYNIGFCPTIFTYTITGVDNNTVSGEPSFVNSGSSLTSGQVRVTNSGSTYQRNGTVTFGITETGFTTKLSRAVGSNLIVKITYTAVEYNM